MSVSPSPSKSVGVILSVGLPNWLVTFPSVERCSHHSCVPGLNIATSVLLSPSKSNGACRAIALQLPSKVQFAPTLPALEPPWTFIDADPAISWTAAFMIRKTPDPDQFRCVPATEDLSSRNGSVTGAQTEPAWRFTK